MKVTEKFRTPIKLREGVYVVGRYYTESGRYIRDILYYGSNPSEVWS